MSETKASMQKNLIFKVHTCRIRKKRYQIYSTPSTRVQIMRKKGLNSIDKSVFLKIQGISCRLSSFNWTNGCTNGYNGKLDLKLFTSVRLCPQ